MKKNHFTVPSIAAVLIAVLSLAGCGNDVKSIEYGELKHLSQQDREATLNALKDEEKAAIMAAGMKYAFSGDSTTINGKTLGELIEEGKAIVDRAKEQSK